METDCMKQALYTLCIYFHLLERVHVARVNAVLNLSSDVKRTHSSEHP